MQPTPRTSIRKRGKMIFVIAGLVILLVLLGILAANQITGPPKVLGVRDGRLADVPSSPNCVSTMTTSAVHEADPLSFHCSADSAWNELSGLIAQWPRSRVITQTDNYMHVEVHTRLLRFVDDMEFYLPSDAQVIHFRSASRFGHSDLGVNRDRMEAIRSRFQQRLRDPAGQNGTGTGTF